MRSDETARLRHVIQRLNETNAGPDAFEDAKPPGHWVAIDQGAIRAWELVDDDRVVARVFAPYGGGSWRVESFAAKHERPTRLAPAAPVPLAEALRGLQRYRRASTRPSRLERHASDAQDRLVRAEFGADAARERYRGARAAERGELRRSYDDALAREATALRASREADIALAEERADDRAAARRERGERGERA